MILRFLHWLRHRNDPPPLVVPPESYGFIPRRYWRGRRGR